MRGRLIIAGAGVTVLLGGTVAPAALAVEPDPVEPPTPTVTVTATETTTATETATVTTTETATATVTADPTSIPVGEHEAETGYRVDPVTGDVIVTEGSGTTLLVIVWVLAIVCGLATVWLVLP